MIKYVSNPLVLLLVLLSPAHYYLHVSTCKTLTACANKFIHYPELIFQILSRIKGLYEPGVPYFVHIISFAPAKRLKGQLHVKSLVI